MRSDPIELEIFKNIYHSIAEEMGASLRRTAFSPNIKERRDYSCAIFDAHGEVIAMGDHMPVHLGSMPMSVRAAIDSFPLGPGDLVMLNDPFRGGTHLPDITLVAPVYRRKRRGQDALATAGGKPGATENGPDFYVASRAHHADVGGTYPGSMGLCREIYQEGLRIPPVRIMRAGKMDRDVLALLLNNVRTPNEREGDLGAQIAACHTGLSACARFARYGSAGAIGVAQAADYSERMMGVSGAGAEGHVPGRRFHGQRRNQRLSGEDCSDGAQRPRGRVAHATGSQTVTVDFSGSDAQ
jgi:N-methylhydantoinase B